MPPIALKLLFNKYVAIFAIVAVLYGYFKYQEHQINLLKTDIETSEKNNTKLKDNITVMQSSLDNQQEMIEKSQRNLRKITIMHNEMRNREKVLENKVIHLDDKFIGKKKEKDRLANLSMKKPGLIGRMITKGTNSKMRCMEILTGSPLTEEESTPGYKGNRECMEYFTK